MNRPFELIRKVKPHNYKGSPSFQPRERFIKDSNLIYTRDILITLLRDTLERNYAFSTVEKNNLLNLVHLVELRIYD